MGKRRRIKNIRYDLPSGWDKLLPFFAFSMAEYFTYIPGLSENQTYVPGPSVRSKGGEERTISLDALIHILQSRLDLSSTQRLNPIRLELNKAPGNDSHRSRRPGTAWPAPGYILRPRTLGHRLALVLFPIRYPIGCGSFMSIR